MKRMFSFILGLAFIFELIYKIVTCPNCEDNIFMFRVPGLVKILFLAVLIIGLMYPVYKENWAKKNED